MSATPRQGADRAARLARAARLCGTGEKLCPAERTTELLEAIIEPGDRVAIEDDNQKQADFLAAALAKADPTRLHDLHMVQSPARTRRSSIRSPTVRTACAASRSATS